jgi:hypothetical protein
MASPPQHASSKRPSCQRAHMQETALSSTRLERSLHYLIKHTVPSGYPWLAGGTKFVIDNEPQLLQITSWAGLVARAASIRGCNQAVLGPV